MASKLLGTKRLLGLSTSLRLGFCDWVWVGTCLSLVIWVQAVVRESLSLLLLPLWCPALPEPNQAEQRRSE